MVLLDDLALLVLAAVGAVAVLEFLGVPAIQIVTGWLTAAFWGVVDWVFGLIGGFVDSMIDWLVDQATFW